MTAMLVKVLVGILALGLGILIGMPAKAGRSGVKAERWKLHGRANRTGVHSDADLEELERTLGRRTALRNRTKRYFTPIDLLRRVNKGSDRRRSRRYFHTAAPTKKPPGGAKGTTATTPRGNRRAP